MGCMHATNDCLANKSPQRQQRLQSCLEAVGDSHGRLHRNPWRRCLALGARALAVVEAADGVLVALLRERAVAPHVVVALGVDGVHVRLEHREVVHPEHARALRHALGQALALQQACAREAVRVGWARTSMHGGTSSLPPACWTPVLRMPMRHRLDAPSSQGGERVVFSPGADGA